ncbi:hypothetical protein B0H14DRAFT_3134785 [Mycena olivaceomarginata]|nr:hypothetical protein B0H14DRAFT_3134785 [Mycena olivaceomarginata]
MSYSLTQTFTSGRSVQVLWGGSGAATGPLDLLRNRDATSSLGPFNGQVAAIAQLRGESYFITTNTDYVPTLPSLQLPHALFLRSNMRYGTDNPTLWPQQFTAHYCHLPVIAKQGTHPELDVMWWDPSPADFVVRSMVTRGLGRLHYQCMSRFLPPINDLVAKCKHLEFLTYSLQTLPTTYVKMVFAVTSLQRAFLELDALHNYTTIYKLRIDNYMSAPSASTPVSQCVDAFTTVPTVAQQLWAARLPFWFLRPTFVFDAENILAVVPLMEPSFYVPDAPGDGGPPVVYSRNSTTDKIAEIHLAAVQTPWYRDPFKTTGNRCRSPSPPPTTVPQPVASSSRPVASSSCPAVQSNNQQRRFKPYHSNAPPKAPAKGPVKTQQDKFRTLAVEEMPPSIVAWADALAQVDQSITPFTIDPADRRYILPEPALFVNSMPEHRRKFLHHWTPPFRRLHLHVKSSPAHAASHRPGMERRLGRPYDEARCTQIQTWGFRLSLIAQHDNYHFNQIVIFSNGFKMHSHYLSYTNAERQVKRDTLETSLRLIKNENYMGVKEGLAGQGQGGMLLGIPLEMSKRSFAVTAIEECHRYVAREATLMLDWTKFPHPNIIHRVAEHVTWSPSQMQELETAVCRYYTQAFWEYFGRAAVVPLRLDHDVEQEEGQL